ncbi:MAG: MFS transporter [Promethearchaeota archaeon]
MADGPQKTSKSPPVLLYALPRLGTSMLIGVIDFALLFLYSSAYELRGIYVGVSLFLGKVSIAFFQFFFGWVSDHTPFSKRFGRRKQYLFAFAPLLTITFILLMLPGLFLGASPPELQLFAWFACFNMVFQGLYGVTSPYQAWMAELYPAPERPKVSTIQNIFNFLGSAVMVVFSMLVLTNTKTQLQANPADIPPELLYSVFIFGSLVTVFFFISASLLPVEPEREIKGNMVQDFKNILKDRNFMLVTLMIGFASFAWSMSQQYLLSFADEVLALDTTEYVILAALMVVTLIASIVYWKRSISKIGKKTTLSRVFLYAAVVMPFSLFGLVRMENYLVFGLFFIPGVAVAIGGWNLFPYLLYADLAEDDEKRGGHMKAGIYAGFPSIPLNLFQAVGLFIAGAILELPDYAFQAGVKSLGYVMWGPICAAILVGVYFYTKRVVRLDFEWEAGEKVPPEVDGDE